MTEEAAHGDPVLLRRLEERLLDPTVRTSGADVAHLLADDFLEFGSSGRVFGKPQIVEALRSEPPVQRSLTDFSARSLAPGVVLVTYRASRGNLDGQPATTSLRSSIWKRIDGRWQVVFHQGTPASEQSQGNE
jgi:hypothetical protein